VNARVQQLSSSGLAGPLATELGQLSALTVLRLSSGKLSGTIPTQIGQLTSLKELYRSLLLLFLRFLPPCDSFLIPDVAGP